jgi:hypothetical protein
MTIRHVIGIDLGTSKSGVCWIAGNRITVLRTIQTDNLIAPPRQNSWVGFGHEHY